MWSSCGRVLKLFHGFSKSFLLALSVYSFKDNILRISCCQSNLSFIAAFSSVTIRMTPQILTYGSWPSPITSKFVAEGGIKLTEDISIDDQGRIYWTEVRSHEGGRYVICSWKPGESAHSCWTATEFSARTRVNEYGSGAFFVSAKDSAVYFSNAKDNRLYRQTCSTDTPEVVTVENKEWMYANGEFIQKLDRIITIREDHSVVKSGRKTESETTIVSINPETKEQRILVSGADFYSTPRVSPDGSKLVWTQWNHPNMPWDSTEIWLAELDSTGDSVQKNTSKKVAGGPGISAIYPNWSLDGELLLISDQDDGWWNLFLHKEGINENLHKCHLEIGGPHWIFGRDAYAFLQGKSKGKVATTFGSELGILDLKSRDYKVLDIGSLHPSRAIVSSPDGSLYLVASGPTKFPQLIRVDPLTSKVEVIKTSNDNIIEEGYISVPEYISFPTSDKQTAYGFLYMPKNKDYVGPEGTLPPLLVRAHGGPTSAAEGSLNLKHQYLTSRGFAILDVDYRGSTGHGRAFRDALQGNWGIHDVEDVCSGAEHLVREGQVNPKQLCIDGGSAGGYTTLAALTFKSVFKAGVSNYGVSDLIGLTEETHKFESRYLDGLVGPFPEAEAVYKERSPINHVHKLDKAMAFFQGGDDKVVLPNQAEKMFEAVKAKGLPTALVIFPEEQHGFIISKNIQKAIDGEYYFLAKVFGFEPTDTKVDMEIFNLAS